MFCYIKWEFFLYKRFAFSKKMGFEVWQGCWEILGPTSNWTVLSIGLHPSNIQALLDYLEAPVYKRSYPFLGTFYSSLQDAIGRQAGSFVSSSVSFLPQSFGSVQLCIEQTPTPMCFNSVQILKGVTIETSKGYGLFYPLKKNAQPIIVFESASLFPICI